MSRLHVQVGYVAVDGGANSLLKVDYEGLNNYFASPTISSAHA